jgi:NTP pyrophosphatase (non-canonical NTP hydrolase)
MTLKELGKKVFENAKEKGFYDAYNNLIEHPSLNKQEREFVKYLWRANRLMLIVSELAEGLEGLRHNNLSSDPTSGGLAEELADAQIRLVDFATDLDLDLDTIVQNKMNYNYKREKMHGGKIA